MPDTLNRRPGPPQRPHQPIPAEKSVEPHPDQMMTSHSTARTSGKCSVCAIEIRTMAFRGTGVCGEIHRKIRDGEPLVPARAVA